MAFNKIQAITALCAINERSPVLCADMVLQEGTGAEALMWCRAVGGCLAAAGVVCNVYKNSVRVLNQGVFADLDTIINVSVNETQITIEHTDPKTLASGRYIRTSWCTPLEAALLTLTIL